ncbi:serine/threonine-protein phosphatase [Ruminococcus sp.]|uniref:serine/threonine-protein phosphatase n=1 Tax=Ruminococcus sp. TaxID=41978 RepID=UPI002604DAE0|nr:serine/threonine-protein phosphatase [Ruminococcus sp.]MDD6988093.1 SpoIIE family protein phosphatase [Ruminococcus sp.]MDY6200842.1 SpoIIE family protein phosphatase [Ruminococcus sp.]
MESTKALRRKTSDNRNDFVRNGAVNLAYLLCGILVSRGTLLGTLAPFGASYAAAVPKKYLFSSLVGTAFGYILLKPTDSFRYIAVIVAIGALRWLMGDIEKVSRSRLFAPLAAFLPTLATGIALLFASTSTLSSFADCFIEAVLSGAAAYFISVSVQLADEKRGISAYTRQETACLVMTGCVLILAFGSITFENISLGRIIAITAVLLCARYGGVNGGAVCGIATGAVFSIASRAQGFVCGGFAFGGLMTGMFAPVGKLGCAIAFLISNGIMSLAFGGNTQLAAVLIESLVGSVVFMILPKEVGNIISPVFSNEKNSSLGETLRKNIVMRLDFASKAIYNVRNDVNSVSDKLKDLYSPSFSVVCENVEKEVCNNCGLKTYCYEHKQGVTRDDFFRLEELLKAQGRISESDVEDAFVKNCCKKGEIARSMNLNYREYLSALEAQRRVSDVRGVVAGQFSGVSDILSDLSDEFKNTMRCDTDSSERIISALSALGAIPVECVCLVSDGGRMSVELELSTKGDSKLSKGTIMREVSKCCGRRFDLPTVTCEGDRIRAALCEMPVYDVEIGSDQHIANNGRLCGDCLDYFNDGFGKTYALVCDGMGTGGRAAVDGNMAVSVMGRLLRSGLSADSSLQIVNSALMVKSEDESLSTLDLTGVDLYTGKVTLKKAGAPATFVRKNGRVMVREMPSLPVGILNGVKFSSDTVNLSSGDMVVMVSDGVITGDEKWLEKLIRSWNEGSTQELARAVVDEAIKRRGDSPDDDITALAIRITDNEV